MAALMNTGEACTASGSYSPDCRCHRAVFFLAGDLLPVCPGCGKVVRWRLAKPMAIGTRRYRTGS